MNDDISINAQHQFETMLNRHAQKQGTTSKLLQQLITYEQQKVHQERRNGAKKHLRKMIEDSLEGQE